MAQTFIKQIVEKKNLQAYIDETKARFKPIFWPVLLGKKYTDNLTYESLVGDMRSGVAANVTAFNVSAPLHSRDVLRKLSGSIPSMRGKRSMDEKDLITFIQAMKSADANQKRLLSLIFGDVEWASNAPHKRIDWLISRALSTGKIVLDTTTNAVGLVTQSEVDFEVPADHKFGTEGAVWSDAEGATPLTDLRKAFFEPMADLGLSGGVIRMHPTKVFQMLAADETKTLLGTLSSGRIGPQNIQLQHVNDWLSANGYPLIRPFNASVGIEKDGKVIYSNPWEQNNVVWTPDGQVGTLHIGPIVEESHPQPQVSYASYLDNLVKKFSEVDPVQEFTAFEMNAFPSLDIADQMLMLNTGNVGSFE